MLATFPDGDWELNVPLGDVPLELIQQEGLTKAARLYRPQRRRVDAVAWRADAYYLIETKIRDPFEGIGRLQTYAREAARTPDLPGFDGQPIIPRLVVPFVIQRDQMASDEAGIELVEFFQDWIGDYLIERQQYFTAAFRIARADKMRMRELLNLE